MHATPSRTQQALIERSPWWDSFRSISGTLLSALWSGSSYFVSSAASLACLVGDRYMKESKSDIGEDWDELNDFSPDKGVVTQQPLDNAQASGHRKNKG